MWLVVIAVGAGSYLMRLVPLLLVGRLALSPRLEQGLNRAGTAALTAVTVSAATHASSSGGVVPTMAALGAGALAASRSWSLLRVVAVGVAASAAAAAVL